MSYLNAKDKYRHLLKCYSKFDHDDCDLEFEYVYDGNLRTLIDEFNLLSVIAEGNQWEQVKNMLKWVSDTFIWDGSTMDIPNRKNARTIAELGVKNGTNCWLLSVMMAEFLLAIGFKARFVRCLPFNYKDGDCHVVVHVYIDDLNKWVMVDPSFNGYVLNQNKIPMSLMEFRKAVMNDDLIIVNADLNENGAPLDHDEYKTYMAKNLFQFETYQTTGYGCENITNNHLIRLIAKDFDGNRFTRQNIKHRQIIVNEMNNDRLKDLFKVHKKRMKRVNYTNNELCFWNV
ncbi:transglutaminase-like domain-containing protein [Vallitalea okinawensis]|uniref:transglutaminase-like domain-containing protein n=1 Tax=Vallitalea okinawensis TaxID=2078660 RepID=UPI000CFE0E34|nr:transglutaminase-like domain-containing protein [Vallitalea okinawensis]